MNSKILRRFIKITDLSNSLVLENYAREVLQEITLFLYLKQNFLTFQFFMVEQH